MSTQKPLPKDLKQLEQKPRFKQFYKQHTVEQLEEKLIDAGVEYGSDENKAALTWRYMNAKGMDFDNQANDAPVRHDEPVPKDGSHADNNVSTEPTPQDDDSKASDTANDSEQPSESADQSAEPSVNDESVDNAAKESNDNAAKESNDNAGATPPVSANDNRVPTGNGSEEEQSNAGDADQGNHAAAMPAMPVKIKDHREFIEVTNNGAYNFYETATGTMVKARETTKIYTTATIDKAHILRNLSQYNQTRGNLLKITN